MNRIETSSLEFVRIEPRGNAVQNKFWVKQEGILKLVKPSYGDTDQDIIEALSSEILDKLNINSVKVQLGYDNILKTNCCIVESFLTDEADVLYEMLEWKNTDNVSDAFEQVINKYSNLYKITEEELDLLKRDYIRTIFGKCILENIDSKLDNIGLIYNEKYNNYRIPPSYDNGLSFRSFDSATKPLSFIGNDLFETSDVINYILDNYIEYVSDIIVSLSDLVEHVDILDKYELSDIKKNYIISYLNNVNNNIQSKENVNEYQRYKS